VEEIQSYGRWALVVLLFAALVWRERRRLTLRRLLIEAAIVTVAYFAYFLVRGFTQSSEKEALDNAAEIIDLERTLGILWEPRWQAAIIDHQFLVDLVNWMYIWGHWPLILGLAIWLYGERRPSYFMFRNAFMISGAIGLVIFVLYPVAPPRLTDMDVVDTVTLHSEAYRVLQPKALTNQYAAVPSLHFGWNLLVGIAIVSETRAWWARAFGVAIPVLMFFAIVLTANHYIIDAVFGGALALFGLAVAARITPAPEQWFARAPEGVVAP
jgi:hypothetical protein